MAFYHLVHRNYCQQFFLATVSLLTNASTTYSLPERIWHFSTYSLPETPNLIATNFCWQLTHYRKHPEPRYSWGKSWWRIFIEKKKHHYYYIYMLPFHLYSLMHNCYLFLFLHILIYSRSYDNLPLIRFLKSDTVTWLKVFFVFLNFQHTRHQFTISADQIFNIYGFLKCTIIME